MKRFTNIGIAHLAIVLILVLSAGCTSTTIVEPFYRPADAQVDQAYISPTADFGSYTKLMAMPLEIYYPENGPAPTQSDLDRLREVFRNAFLTEVGGVYQIVSEPGPDVMRILAQVIDLKQMAPNGRFEASGRLREVVTSGQLTLLLEFQDSVSGRVLARAGEAEQGAATGVTNESESWLQVEAAARRWAGMLKQFLDENLG